MTLVCLGSLEVLHTSFLICFVKMTVMEEFSSAEDVSRQTTVCWVWLFVLQIFFSVFMSDELG